MNHQVFLTVSKSFEITSAIRNLLCPEPTNGSIHGICQVSWSTTSSALWRRYLPKIPEDVGGLLCNSVLTTPPAVRWIDTVIWSLKNIFMPMDYRCGIQSKSSWVFLKVTSFQKGAAKKSSHLFISFPESSGELLHGLPGAKPNSQAVLKAQYRTCAEVPSRLKHCLASGVKS